MEQANHDAITCGQALDAGLTSASIRARGEQRALATRAARRLRHLQRPDPPDAYLSAVVLHADPGAALSHHTAAELHGLLDQPAPLVHVTVPTARRPRRAAGIVLHRSNRLAVATHPAGLHDRGASESPTRLARKSPCPFVKQIRPRQGPAKTSTLVKVHFVAIY